MTKTLTQPFKWLGSKVRMRPRVLEILATIPRKLYVEPFGGSGAIFFGKEPENSVYNDLNGLLVNFFRKLRSEQDRELIRDLANHTPASDEYWHEFKDVCKAYQTKDENRLKETLAKANLSEYETETAVAFAFFYCQSLSFGGSVLHSYGEDVKPRGGNRHATAVSLLDEYAERLSKTTITNRDFRDCLERYDDKETLFYCDPPYECDSSGDYKQGWRSSDTSDLVRILCGVKGSVVLSCYDGELYKPLLDANYEKSDFSVKSSLRRGFSEDSTLNRVETIYFRRSGTKTSTPEPAPEYDSQRTLF